MIGKEVIYSLYHNIYKGCFLRYCMVAKEITRMNRIRMILDEVPKRKVLRRVFVAKESLEHGISSRTIDDYLMTLIDAGKVVCKEKMIWRGE